METNIRIEDKNKYEDTIKGWVDAVDQRINVLREQAASVEQSAKADFQERINQMQTRRKFQENTQLN